MRHRVGALPLQRAQAGVAADRVGSVRHQSRQHGGLDVPGGEPDRAVAHRKRVVLQRPEDGALALGPGEGRLEGREPIGGSGHGAQTWKTATRCRSASDSPARLLAAPVICSTATRF